MAKLTIMRGVSGSGKSTRARCYRDAIIVSRDDLRAALFPLSDEEYYKAPKEVMYAREEYVSTVEAAAIKNGLLAGRHVVSDNTNVQMKFVNKIAKIGYSVGADVVIHLMDVPLNVAIERAAGRALAGGRNVPIDAIKRQHSQLQGSKTAKLTPPPVVTPYDGTPGKPKAFLVDIDGTLAHMRDLRGPFDWAKVGVDEVDQTIADIANVLKGDGYSWSTGDSPQMIVMSGRDESCRRETQVWLNEHFIRYDELFMRPEKDMRADNIVKAELFDKHVRDNYDVKFVLDDRDQVVEMWRRMGLKCLQVEPGNF